MYICSKFLSREGAAHWGRTCCDGIPSLCVTLLHNLNASLLRLDSPDKHTGHTAIPQYSYEPSESHWGLLKLCKVPHSCRTLAFLNASWAPQNRGRRARARVCEINPSFFFLPLCLISCCYHTMTWPLCPVVRCLSEKEMHHRFYIYLYRQR